MKILLLDLVYAVCLVIMYSQGLLGWYPNDPNIFKAGVSILTGIFVSLGIVKTNFLTTKRQKLLDISTNSYSLDECIKLYDTLDSKIFKHNLDTVRKQLVKTKTFRKNFSNLLETKFSKGSMSYDKFTAAVDSAITSIINIAVTMAMQVQMFDEADYSNIKRLIETKEYLKDDIDDSLQNMKYDVYLDNYYSITNLVNSIEQLLFKLNALFNELANINATSLNENNEKLLEELNDLIQETHFYS